MRSLLRRLFVMLVALAFIAGGVGGFAAPSVAAADPCTQEHMPGHDHSGQTPTKSQGQDTARICQQCCLGICVSVPNIPAAVTISPVAVTSIVFWDTTRSGGGRSIKPEHGPPRLLA
jgi:hypothetical protein